MVRAEHDNMSVLDYEKVISLMSVVAIRSVSIERPELAICCRWRFSIASDRPAVQLPYYVPPRNRYELPERVCFKIFLHN